MFKIICVTNRQLCTESFLSRIDKLSEASVDRIILREKDMDAESYKALAKSTAEICRKYNIPFSVHSRYDISCDVHLTMPLLCSMPENKINNRILGVSVHSVEEALEAEKSGADYITAGHIFATDCKRGVPPRGIEFLKNICKTVSIPVYAIGGINSENIFEIYKCGAAGACIMSGLMTCDEPVMYIDKLRRAIKGGIYYE